MFVIVAVRLVCIANVVNRFNSTGVLSNAELALFGVLPNSDFTPLAVLSSGIFTVTAVPYLVLCEACV